MALRAGGSGVTGVYVGDRAASAVRVGDDLAWSAAPPDPFPGAAYAVLLGSGQGGHAAGTLLFVRSETYEGGSTVTDVDGSTWAGTVWEVDESQDRRRSESVPVPWEGDQPSVAAVSFRHRVRPRTCARWLYGNRRVTAVDLSMLDCSRFYEGASSRDDVGLWRMFSGCSALASVTGAPTMLGGGSGGVSAEYMFYGCDSLATVDMTGWPYLYKMNSMFRYCSSLGTVTLGVSQVDIGTYDGGRFAGPFIGCTSLAALVIPCGSVVTSSLDDYMFSVDWYGRDSADARVYVPDALVDDYKASTAWGRYADIILPMGQLPPGA